MQLIEEEPRPRDTDYISWTGPGFVRVQEGGNLEFTIDDVMMSGEYDVVLRYEPLVSEEKRTFGCLQSPYYPSQPLQRKCGKAFLFF